MFTDYQPPWRIYVFAAVFVSTALWFLISYFLFSVSLEALRNVGLVAVTTYLLWYVFATWAWGWPYLPFKSLLVTVPDLRGRWVGFFTSSADNYKEKRSLSLEVRQTLLHIECLGRGPDNVGESYSARLLTNADGSRFKLLSASRMKRTGPTARPGDDHDAFALLAVEEDGQRRLLNGAYVTDRAPEPTKGVISLEWKGRLK